MAAMESRKLLDSVMGQLDSTMRTSMQQALAGQKVTPKQQQVMDQMRVKMVAMFKNELRWETLEPELIVVYEKSFSQDEIDGMIKFYKSKAGRAVIAKMPIVMQNTMGLMQQKMASLMPKIQQMEKDAIAQVKAAEEKQ